MTGQAFLILSFQLQNATDEARRRTAVSRAYYGALHIANELLAEFGVHLPKGSNKHEKVPEILMNSGSALAATAGKILDNLRGDRNNADYKIDNISFGTEQLAILGVNRAKSIVERLSECSKEPARTPARDGIRKYAHEVHKCLLTD